MAALNREQLKTLASSVGFTGADVDIAAAVALAESGGNPSEHNSTPPDDSYGLWQINMLGSMGPERRKRFGISNNTELFRPATNAKAAKMIHEQSGWKAWTTYTRGTYKKYMPDGQSVASGSTGTASTGAAVATEETDDSWSGKIQSGLNAVGANILKTGSNIGGIVLAIVFLVLGVIILARGMIPYGKVFKAGKNLSKAVK